MQGTETHHTLAYFFTLAIYVFFTYFLVKILSRDVSAVCIMGVADQDVLMQSALATVYTAVTAVNILHNKAHGALCTRDVLLLLLLSIMYKLIWFKMLYRLYKVNQHIEDRKKRFLLLGKRKWHGKIINIGEEAKLFERWNSMWQNELNELISNNYSVARVHLDPYLRQHVPLTFKGEYAVRLAPTSELPYFENVLPKSELESLVPWASECSKIKAKLMMDRNERDRIDAREVSFIEGSLILDDREYYFRPSDGKINAFWKNKTRPQCVHLLAISNDETRVPFESTTLSRGGALSDMGGGGWLQLDIFENLRYERVGVWHPKIMKQRFIPVLKRLNTKVKARALEHEMAQIAKEQIAYSPSNIVKFLLSDTKWSEFSRDLHLDWCKERVYEQLHDEFFSGKMDEGIIVFVDSLDFSPRAKILDQNGQQYAPSELPFLEKNVRLVRDMRMK